MSDKNINKPDLTDIEWNVRRALDLMAIRGVSGFYIDVEDGSIDFSDSIGGGNHWSRYLPKDDAAIMDGEMFSRTILEGGSLYDYCLKILEKEASTLKIDGRYALHPCTGLTISLDDDQDDSDEQVVVLYKSPFMCQENRLWAEWASPDWKFHGFVDVTTSMLEWENSPGELLENIRSELADGVLHEDLDLFDFTDHEMNRMVAHIDSLHASDDCDYSYPYEIDLVNPHAIFPAILLRPQKNKITDDLPIATWMDKWRQQNPQSFPYLEGRLIKSFANIVSRSNIPPFSHMKGGE